MGDDEQKAFELLRKNRQIQKPIIEKFNGTWIKEIGDGVLASFHTVTDTVICAIEIQKACDKIDDLKLRIGIHLGEVVFEDNDVFGDGVNIASRLQALAPIGGIWVSESVYKNVANKKDIKTKFVREGILKNVREAVGVYEVITETEQYSSLHVEKSKTISEKSIAVLPFVNMSSDPEQEFFSDGLTEEIITDLSRLEKLLVISRNSMMTFKGTHNKTKEIANEVNARYVLEGSVRKSGNNLRITAKLIDAYNDSHLWAEKYNGTIEDIFDIQERVSRSIVEALNLKLTEEEDSHLSSHPIQNTKAYECYIRARQEIWKFTEKGLDNAVILAQRGLELMGDNALLYATKSLALLFIQHYGIRSDPSNLNEAYGYAAKCMELDPNLPQVQFVQGILAFKKGHLQEAANIFKKVLHKDQNNPEALHFLIVSCFLSGKPAAAWPFAERLLQVDPLTTISHSFPGFIELFSGNIEESLPYHQKWLQMDPEGPFTRYWCACNFAFNNKLEDSINLLNSLIKDTPALIFGKFARFFKSALLCDRENALKYITDELKREAELLDYLPLYIAWGFALIGEKMKQYTGLTEVSALAIHLIRFF